MYYLEYDGAMMELNNHVCRQRKITWSIYTFTFFFILKWFLKICQQIIEIHWEIQSFIRLRWHHFIHIRCLCTNNKNKSRKPNFIYNLFLLVVRRFLQICGVGKAKLQRKWTTTFIVQRPVNKRVGRRKNKLNVMSKNQSSLCKLIN